MKGLYNNNAGLFIRNYEDEWQQVADNMVKAFPYIESQFGKYPYKQFSFIQGGDGGMEYPMATLLKGAGESVVYHELLHSWFPMIMSNNESLTPWIDEGFASYAEGKVVAFLKSDTSGTEHKDNYAAYVQLARSAYAEPLTTHADQYKTNYGYSRSSYSKGAVFYEQLGYIIGRQNLHLMFLELYRKFRFRHVDQHDILRVAESVSGMQLGWYGSYFVNTTNTINYGIDSLWQEGNKIKVRMKNTGQMPMPIDLMITFKDGSKHLAHIPQYLSFGNKPAEDSTVKRTVHEPWKATHPTYTVELDGALINVQLAEIDPSQRMADVNRNDNRLEIKW
jgi:aminopeptidase N